MNKEIARIIALVADRTRSDIGSLARLVKEHCDEESHKEFSMAIGQVVYEISHELMDRVFDKFPDIRSEMEDRLKKYGRSYY
jgi:hypothetical protein